MDDVEFEKLHANISEKYAINFWTDAAKAYRTLLQQMMLIGGGISAFSMPAVVAVGLPPEVKCMFALAVVCFVLGTFAACAQLSSVMKHEVHWGRCAKLWASKKDANAKTFMKRFYRQRFEQSTEPDIVQTAVESLFVAGAIFILTALSLIVCRLTA